VRNHVVDQRDGGDVEVALELGVDQGPPEVRHVDHPAAHRAGDAEGSLGDPLVRLLAQKFACDVEEALAPPVLEDLLADERRAVVLEDGQTRIRAADVAREDHARVPFTTRCRAIIMRSACWNPLTT
jgi:hypothetical protein